jgi:hypothetical protein
MFGPTLEPTQPLLQWVLGSLPHKATGIVILNTQLNLMLRLKREFTPVLYNVPL